MHLTCAGTLVAEEIVLSEFPEDLRRQITVLPRVDQTALARLYQDADVFVFPSLYEGFSRAILEAMASRLPIITTAVGVAADALRHEESALFVPKRNAAAIVAAVRRLHADPALAAHMGRAAAAAADEYRLDVMELRTVDAILDVAGVDR
jgi:glycosyltransferase involved in cell wall biosynthesis